MTENFDINNIIFKVLEGNASVEEIEFLSKWIDSEEREIYFNQIKKAWNLTSGPKPSSDKEQQELTTYLKYIKSQKGNRSLRMNFLRFVAVLALPLAIAIYYKSVNNYVDEGVVVAEQTKILPGGYKALLTTAEGKIISLEQEKTIELSDSTLILADGTGIFYPDKKESQTSFQLNRLQTPRGGEYTLTLSDGSKVILNSSSEITFPVCFDDKKREVRVKGEAYFDIKYDADRPFYVITDAVRVRVYGTTFNVNTYAVNGTETVLEFGKIGITGLESDKEYIMNPSQLATFDKEGAFVGIIDVDVEKYIAWKDGKFIFDDESLENIMDVLSRWYDVDIFYTSEKVKDFHFTGHMEKYKEIDRILNALTRMVGVNFMIQNKTIIVS